MNSFVFCSFVLTFLVVQMAGYVIRGEKDSKDGDLGNALSTMTQGVGNFSSEMSELYQKVRMGNGLEDGDDGEEVGGDGMSPDMVLTINQTAGAMAKVAEGLVNGLVTKTGMNKIGVPVLGEDSQVVEAVKRETNNMMMGMAVAMAGMANLMKIGSSN